MAADSDGPPRALMIAAVAVAVAAISVILVIAATREAPPQPTQPIALPAVPAPQAANAACRALADALPQRLGDYQRAPVAQPAPEGATAWRSTGGGEPVVLRCGLDRPADFLVGSPIQVVDRVQWFQVSAEPRSAASPLSAVRSTWYAVDRPVYVALTLPPGSGPTPIQDVSAAIERTITPVPVDPARSG